MGRNMLLLKNPQFFLPNQYETLSNQVLKARVPHFHNDWVKIVDFSNKSIFLPESKLAWAILYIISDFIAWQGQK